MPYVAIKSIKIQKADGTMELRGPGDPVPEAAGWRDTERWVRRGWIAPAEAKAAQPVKATPKPSVPITPAGEPIKDLEAYKAERDGYAARAESGEGTGAVIPDRDTLAKLTKVQLIEMGEKYGLELSDAVLKEELIASVIEAAEAAAAGA